jgi:hypothetical protein
MMNCEMLTFWPMLILFNLWCHWLDRIGLEQCYAHYSGLYRPVMLTNCTYYPDLYPYFTDLLALFILCRDKKGGRRFHVLLKVKDCIFFGLFLSNEPETGLLPSSRDVNNHSINRFVLVSSF